MKVALVLAATCALLVAGAASAGKPGSFAGTKAQKDRAESRRTLGSAADSHTVLFLGSSLDPSDGPTFASSIEVQEALAKGYSVEIDSDAQWAAKSAADFATYRAIVIGDAQDGSNDPMPALLGNLGAWTSAVRGNEFLTGADSEYHARNGDNAPPRNPALSIQRGVDFAAAAGTTGLYFAFGGYGASNIQTVLDGLGSGFSVRAGGADSVHVVAGVPALADLTDAVLSGWSSTYHETMTAIPRGFTVFATQAGGPGNFAFVIRQVRRPTTLTVDIQDDSDSCGAPPGYDVIGSATFTRSPRSNKLQVAVRMQSGDPRALYTEYLYNAVDCSQIATLGSFKTTQRGSGHGRFTADVTGYGSFFVLSYDGVDNNDSAIATLPGPP